MARILIIEDEDLVRKALEFRLKKDGHLVTPCMDGRQGIQTLETGTFDLIITDLMLPYNNGLEVVNRSKELNKATPVIVLSNIGLEHVVMDAFNLGADDYITKPFSPNELSVRVKRLIK